MWLAVEAEIEQASREAWRVQWTGEVPPRKLAAMIDMMAAELQPGECLALTVRPTPAGERPYYYVHRAREGVTA